MRTHFNFLEPALISRVNDDTTKFKSDTCKRAIRIFGENTRRAVNVAAVPGFAFLMGAKWMASGELAKRSTLGRKPNPKVIQKYAAEVGPRAEGLMVEMMTELQNNWREDLVECTTMYEHFGQYCGTSHLATVENLLRSILVDSWGCVEILAEQLYKGAEVEADKATFPAYKTPRDQSMAENFSNLYKFRPLFIKTISDPAVVGPISENCIDALSALRNVIVHNAAFVDDIFLKRIKPGCEFLDRFSKLDPLKTEKVELEGGLVRSLVDSSYKCCYDLVSATDAWIMTWKT